MKASACLQQPRLQASASFCRTVLLRLHFHKAALGSGAEQDEKAPRRSQFHAYRVPVDLGFAVNNSLLSTYQTV